MSHFPLPAEYEVPAPLLSMSDDQRAALLDSVATTAAVITAAHDSRANELAAVYEQRIAQQTAAFDHAIRQFADRSTPEIVARLDGIVARLAPIDRMFNSTASSTKGRVTEEFIMSYLSEGRHAAGRISFTAKTGGMGDLWYTTADGVVILIEIKNKRCITTDDIQKFDRDVQDAYAQGKISAAMIVSVDAQRFPNLANGPLNYRMVAGCPTVHLFVDQMRDLDAAIAALEACVAHEKQCDYTQYCAAHAESTDTADELERMNKIRVAIENSLVVVRQRIADLTARLDGRQPPTAKRRAPRAKKMKVEPQSIPQAATAAQPTATTQ